jgi:hypothetical protein
MKDHRTTLGGALSWASAGLALVGLVAACGTVLSSQDVDRLHDAETASYLAHTGVAPVNESHIAYCQVHCVLTSASQPADPDGGTLACPPCDADGGLMPSPVPPAPADAGADGAAH